MGNGVQKLQLVNDPITRCFALTFEPSLRTTDRKAIIDSQIKINAINGRTEGLTVRSGPNRKTKRVISSKRALFQEHWIAESLNL